jgi:hypothetical protein
MHNIPCTPLNSSMHHQLYALLLLRTARMRPWCSGSSAVLHVSSCSMHTANCSMHNIHHQQLFHAYYPCTPLTAPCTSSLCGSFHAHSLHAVLHVPRLRTLLNHHLISIANCSMHNIPCTLLTAPCTLLCVLLHAHAPRPVCTNRRVRPVRCTLLPVRCIIFQAHR